MMLNKPLWMAWTGLIRLWTGTTGGKVQGQSRETANFQNYFPLEFVMFPWLTLYLWGSAKYGKFLDWQSTDSLSRRTVLNGVSWLVGWLVS